MHRACIEKGGTCTPYHVPKRAQKYTPYSQVTRELSQGCCFERARVIVPWGACDDPRISTLAIPDELMHLKHAHILLHYVSEELRRRVGVLSCDEVLNVCKT